MEKECKGIATIVLEPELTGKILDIGGGGEGIIGRLYGRQVTAIDNRKEELDEIPDCCDKQVMDATCLSYENRSFDYVIFFYSLMYMTEEMQKKAIWEAARVCKEGGSIIIWDCNIASAYPEPFLATLQICLPTEIRNTTYGIVKTDGQSMRSFEDMCRECGVEITAADLEEGHFRIVARK